MMDQEGNQPDLCPYVVLEVELRAGADIILVPKLSLVPEIVPTELGLVEIAAGPRVGVVVPSLGIEAATVPSVAPPAAYPSVAELCLCLSWLLCRVLQLLRLLVRCELCHGSCDLCRSLLLTRPSLLSCRGLWLLVSQLWLSLRI